MTYPVHYVPAGDVLPVFFSSYAGATGASATMTGLAVTDIEIYKDGSTTQRASDAGYTLLDTDGIDFDSITGIHGFSIDTGDNTDAGFYTVGAWFHVVVSAVTIDSQTVNFIACAFRLMPAEAIAGKPKVDVDAWLGTAAATPTVNGVPEVDLTHVAGATTDVSALATNVAAILVDTGTTLDGRLPAVLVSGRIDASVGAMAANVLTATAINADAITAAKVAADVHQETIELAFTYDATADYAGANAGSLVKQIADNAGGSALTEAGIAETVAEYMFSFDTGLDYSGADANSVVKQIADNAGGSSLTTADIADAVWDEATAGHVSAGTFGKLDADIKTDTAAILVDTGTTLDGKIDVIDGNVDSILVDTGTTLDGKIDTIDTNVDSILVDTGTTLQGELDGIQADTEDIQARLPAALTADGNIKADALRISGSAESADRIERSTHGIVLATCDAGGTTTAVIVSSLSPASAVNDQFNGRIITFSHATTTAALRGQSTDITDFDHSTQTFTVTALTTAPASGDLFVIT